MAMTGVTFAERQPVYNQAACRSRFWQSFLEPIPVGWVSAAQPTDSKALAVGCAALTHPDMVGPVKPSFSGFFPPRPRQCCWCEQGAIPLADFVPQRLLSFQALPPPKRRRAGPRRNVTTVDQSDIRVLVNALNDPSGASSFYGAGVRATKGTGPRVGRGFPRSVHTSRPGRPSLRS